MLKGSYTPPQILNLVNEDWGYRSRKTKRQGGKKLSYSGIYQILTNPFYAGIIVYRGNEYVGKHPNMITLDDFEKVQRILGREYKPKPIKHEFAYTGFIRCAECECLYTAETKKKFIKSTNSYRYYNYYHCTRKRRDMVCTQRKSIREEDLEIMILDYLSQCKIIPTFHEWAIESLSQAHDSETEERKVIYEGLLKTLADTQRQLDNLTKMKIKEMISDAEFTKERKTLKNDIVQLKVKIKQTEERAEDWNEVVKQIVDFAFTAKEAFLDNKDDLQKKKEIVLSLGSNFFIKDGKLAFLWHDYFEILKNEYKNLEDEYLRLEPLIKSGNKGKINALESVRLSWLDRLDSNQEKRLQRPL